MESLIIDEAIPSGKHPAPQIYWGNCDCAAGTVEAIRTEGFEWVNHKLMQNTSSFKAVSRILKINLLHIPPQEILIRFYF